MLSPKRRSCCFSLKFSVRHSIDCLVPYLVVYVSATSLTALVILSCWFPRFAHFYSYPWTTTSTIESAGPLISRIDRERTALVIWGTR